MASRRSRSPDSSHEREMDRKGKKPKVCCSDDEPESGSSKNPLAESYKLIMLMTPEELKQLQKRVNNLVACHEIGLKVKEDDAARRRKDAEEAAVQEEYDRFRAEQFRRAQALLEASMPRYPPQLDFLASDAEPDWEPFQHVPEPYSPDVEVEQLAQADLEAEIEEDNWNDFLMGPVDPEEEEYAQQLVDAEDEEDEDGDYEQDDISEVIDEDDEEEDEDDEDEDEDDEEEEEESDGWNRYDEYGDESDDSTD